MAQASQVRKGDSMGFFGNVQTLILEYFDRGIEIEDICKKTRMSQWMVRMILAAHRKDELRKRQ